jgi:hypothetical protein
VVPGKNLRALLWPLAESLAAAAIHEGWLLTWGGRRPRKAK